VTVFVMTMEETFIALAAGGGGGGGLRGAGDGFGEGLRGGGDGSGEGLGLNGGDGGSGDGLGLSGHGEGYGDGPVTCRTQHGSRRAKAARTLPCGCALETLQLVLSKNPAEDCQNGTQHTTALPTGWRPVRSLIPAPPDCCCQRAAGLHTSPPARTARGCHTTNTLHLHHKA
jgi:hypothetical protein